MRNRAKYLCSSISELLLNVPSLWSWAECRAIFCSEIDYFSHPSWVANATNSPDRRCRHIACIWIQQYWRQNQQLDGKRWQLGADSTWAVIVEFISKQCVYNFVYHNKLTTNSNQRSHLYQMIPMLRRKILDKRKSTLLKTHLVNDITLRNPLWMKNVVTLKYTIISNFINFFLFAYSAYTWRTLPLKWLMVYCKISSNALNLFLKHQVFWNM